LIKIPSNVESVDRMRFEDAIDHKNFRIKISEIESG